MSVRVLFFRYAVKSENARDRIAEQFAENPKYFANAMQLLAEIQIMTSRALREWAYFDRVLLTTDARTTHNRRSATPRWMSHRFPFFAGISHKPSFHLFQLGQGDGYLIPYRF